MDGKQVYELLRRHGVDALHHANSVTTSCSLLSVGGLASRKHLEQRGLPQTGQSSDAADKKYGIWNDAFTDLCDIHARVSNRIYYGPVLFVLKAAILLDLPRGTDILITKTNAQYWKDQDPQGSRYFNSIEEFRANIDRYDFGQSITFRNQTGLIPFGNNLTGLLIDDPQLQLDNTDVFERATDKLKRAARGVRPAIRLDRRQCAQSCACRDWYRRHMGFVRTMF